MGDKMILFKEEHVRPILKGCKTQTRRLGKKRWNVGSVHLAKLQMMSTFYFTKLVIKKVWEEPLGSISHEDAMREGFDSIQDFKDAWKRTGAKWVPETMVWVVEFEMAMTDLKPDDWVTLSPRCAEYLIHKETPFRVLSKPWWIFGNEMIAIKSENKYYGAFATEFLLKEENFTGGISHEGL